MIRSTADSRIDTYGLSDSFLEYVPGGSVASVYRRHKKFEEQVIKSFTMQILDGLAYLHSLNILHRVSSLRLADVL